MWLFKQRVIDQGSYQPVTVEIKLVDPVLRALCEDIAGHPEDYHRDQGCIRHRDERDLWIFSQGVFSSSSPVSDPADEEIILINRAATRFFEHDLIARRSEQANRIRAVQSDRPDLPWVVTRVQGALAACRADKSEHIVILADLAQAMIPVLSGTHKIVPVDRQWPDKSGQMHATREQARAANRGMRTGAGS